MSEEIIANLGPLAPLAGAWVSDQGIDTSRIHGEETITKFRERVIFEPLGPTKNGPQELYGLRYSTTTPGMEEVGRRRMPEPRVGVRESRKLTL